VLVEARGHLEETENLLSIARRTDFVRGVVGWLPLTEPRLEALLEHYAAAPKLKGIRHWLGPDTDLESMFSKAIQRGVALLERARLSFDLMLWPPQLAVAPRFVDRHPDQVFVLDHFAKPYIRARELEPWRTQIRELSRRPNVYCKLSGLVTEADWDHWTAQDLQPFLDVALEAFTPRRLMFGSDWPVCTLAAGYARWVQTVEAWLQKLSSDEQELIFGGTAAHVYRLV